MMYKSASETTLKTSSTLTGTDNTEVNRQAARQEREMRDAEAQALRWLEQGHDFILETWKLFQLDLEYNAGMLSISLKALENAHHFTGHGANDVEWAYGVLSSTRTEEAATPAVMIFLRTCPTTDTGPGAVWKIPEEIHSRDLLPHYTGLAKKAVISWARGKLFDQWDEEHEAEQAAAALKAQADALSAAALAKMQEENRAALAAWEATPERQEYLRMMESQRLPLEPEEDEEHDPVLERLIAEARAIREAPLSDFAADAGFGEDGEEIETPPVRVPAPPLRYDSSALEQFEDAAAWERF